MITDKIDIAAWFALAGTVGIILAIVSFVFALLCLTTGVHWIGVAYALVTQSD